MRSGYPGIASIRLMRCWAPRAAKTVHIVVENASIPPWSEDMFVGDNAAPGRESKFARMPSQTGWWDAEIGGDIGERTVLFSYCSRSQFGSSSRSASFGLGGPIPQLVRTVLSCWQLPVRQARDLAGSQSLIHVGA